MDNTNTTNATDATNMPEEYNDMPMNQKSYINDKDFYTNSLLNQKKNNSNNNFLSRHFYKVPDNNQDSFARSLFPNTSICRDTGYLCRLEQNRSRNLNRISYEKDKYITQNLNLNKNVKGKLIDILDSTDGVTN